MANLRALTLFSLMDLVLELAGWVYATQRQASDVEGRRYSC